MSVAEILKKSSLSRDDIVKILSVKDPEEINSIRRKAEDVLLQNCGTDVYYRGLVEFSNQCSGDCYYCGIRKSNSEVKRFTLSTKEIVEAAKWCAEQGYGSIVLQSGERKDDAFIDFVESAVKEIKRVSCSEKLPQGLGVTLCVGEQDGKTYERFFSAGAHRYLLRIETTDPKLFAAIHPPEQTLEARKKSLHLLKETGFQVGTGVMIGLPGQTPEHLADDIMFFGEMDVDMIGMGPFIAHRKTPMSKHLENLEKRSEEIFTESLLMIAATRLFLKDVNIAATTALQAMKDDGREQGLSFGANIIMPQLTPVDVRKEYLLYENKPCLDEGKEQCRFCLERRISSIGRRIAKDKWGDSKHFAKRVLAAEPKKNSTA